MMSNKQLLAALTATLLYVALIPDVPERSSGASPPTGSQPVSGLLDIQEIAAVEVDASPSVAVTVGGAIVPTTIAPPSPLEATWPSDRVLAALRLCESTNNYAAVSPQGLYRGAYQFDQRTWDTTAVRYSRRLDLVGVDPASVTPAVQDQMARWLWQDRGPSPWPTCGWRAGA